MSAVDAGNYYIVLEWVEGFDDFEMRGSEYTDAGDFVVARIEQRARGELSGAPVEATYWFVFELSRGAIIRMDMFRTREQAQAAAGI